MVERARETEDWTWQAEAACRGVSSDLFFPANDDQAEAARSICEACPVRVHCLAFALERGERYGVWGGTTEKERARLGPAQRAAAIRLAARDPRRTGAA